MPLKPSDKISECVARIVELRQRANADANPVWNAELHKLELQWLDVLEGYKAVEQASWFLKDIRARQSAPNEKLAQKEDRIWPTSRCVRVSSAINGTSLADQLQVLVRAAIEHADGKARAAFYLADDAQVELHHITGMPHAYARCVNGFKISKQSLACGLAVATRQSIITPDVSEEPRWEKWLWLAKTFDYRACWSFPIATSTGKVLGSLAMYYKEPREATPRDIDLATVLSRTAATIISH